METAFNTYKLVQNIGNGGNGVVWSAIALDGQSVAIKILNNVNTEKRKRFKNEIGFCMKHNHKNLINVLDYGLCKDKKDDKEVTLMFYVMPLYHETLSDKIKTGIKPEDCILIYESILCGLKYLHDNGCVHRDIKPENILFNENSNEAVISDLGIAHFMPEDLKTFIETKNTKRMANFQYAAPEQRQNGMNVDGRADVYSATLLLNQMFTGEIPESAQIKTIGSVNPEYAFLDDLFFRIYKQNPNERLYPEENILRDLKICIEDNKTNLEKKKLELQNFEFGEIVPYKAQIEDISYDNIKQVLSIKMKSPFYPEWAMILTSGHFNHNLIMGFGPTRFYSVGDSMCVPLDEYSYDEAPIIIKHFKEWMPIVDKLLHEHRLKAIKIREKELEEKRRKEIEKIEFNQKLKKLI